MLRVQVDRAARPGHRPQRSPERSRRPRTTARTSRASCRPCSTSRIRSRRRITSRSARPASTARCAPPAHFAHFTGSEAKIQLARAAPAPRPASAGTSRASCTGVDRRQGRRSTCDGQTFQLPIDDIDHAKLVPDWDAVMHGKSGVGTPPQRTQTHQARASARARSRSTSTKGRRSWKPNSTWSSSRSAEDKNIDKSVLIDALEQAILTAAKRTFGMNREMEAKFNAETGSVDLFLIVNVVEEDDAIEGREITVEQAHDAPASRPSSATSCCSRSSTAPRTPTAPREQDEKFGDLLDLKNAQQEASAASPRRPPSRSSSSASARPSATTSSTSTRTARASSSRGIVRRFERGNTHRRPRQGRGRAADARAGAARDYRAGDRIKALRPRHRPQRARPADHPVAHAQGPAREAVREEVPEIYEKIVRIEASAREPGARAKIAVSVARPRRRSGRRLRRHEGLARPGGRAGAARREDRHRSVRRRSGALRVQRDRAGRGHARHHRRRRPHAWS